MGSVSRIRAGLVFIGLLALTLAIAPEPALRAQAPQRKGPEHAKTVRRLAITNAMVIYGNAKPPFGPVDILIQDGLIAQIQPSALRHHRS